MAAFCRQCSFLNWGYDSQDLAGLNKEQTLESDEGFPAICEGCGFIRVDHAGQCLGDASCSETHTRPERFHSTWFDACVLFSMEKNEEALKGLAEYD